MIDEAIKMEDGDLKEGLIFTIANHMKKCYLNWNKDTVEDTAIFDHLYELSDGKINLNKKDEDLTEASNLLRSKKRHSSNNNNNKSKKKHRKRY